MTGNGRLLLAAAALVALASPSCGSDDEPPNRPRTNTTSSGASSGSGSGATGGGGESGGSGGSGSGGESAGNGGGGTGGGGDERCEDSVDNDGDGQTDCADADCASACADSCAAPALVADPSELTGDTTDHAALVDPTCLSINGSGPEVVYKVTAAQSGMLDVRLESTAILGVSVRPSCASAAGELGCNGIPSPDGAVKLSVPITQGESVLVAVDGFGETDKGAYALAIKSRPVACGDAIKDPAEGCDDGNTTSGDGCSAACALEASEIEPNGTAMTANAYSSPWFAAIQPAGDIDVVSVVIGAPPSSLAVSTFDLGDGACAAAAMDTFVDIIAPDGSTVLASDDDGGEGLCARASALGLSAGTYFIRVKAAAPSAVFPYALAIAQEKCGNGVTALGEQCDDGGLAAGDGCSPICELEPTETEGNNTPMAADAYADPWYAAISPAGDVDVVSVSVPGPSSTLSAMTVDKGDGGCAAGAIDSEIEILGTNGSTVLASDDDNGEGACSFTAAAGLASGVYYVRVKASALAAGTAFGYGLVVDVQ
jgi:cysteine-rich repeat protein